MQAATSIASGRVSAKFILACGPTRFSAIASASNAWGVGDKIVAGAAGYDMAGRALLLGKPAAGLDVRGERARRREKPKKHTYSNPFHRRPP
jgi:hypothetical protein